MSFKRFIRERWKELRWGMSSYLAPAVTAFNLIFLLSLYFNVTGIAFYFLVVWILGLLVLTGVTVGHIHRLLQQDTDTLMENQAVIDEIVRRVKEEILAGAKREVMDKQ